MAQKRSRFVQAVAWFLLLGVVGITAIALLSSRYGWPIYLELLSHFQRQYWLLSVVALAAIALTRCRWPTLIAIACVAVLTTPLLPWYLPPQFLQAQPEGNFRILVSNLNTKNRNFEAALTMTRAENPDLALFMEVDDRWVEQLNTLLTTLPHFSGRSDPFNRGIVIYSRYPLDAVEVIDLAPDSTPSITATVEVNGQRLAVVGTHPLPPVRPSLFHSRNRQLDQLGQHLQTMQEPQVVIGDFNITMWSPYYKRFKRQTGLKNVRDGFGVLPSWPTGGTYSTIPAWVTELLAIPIDHGLLSPELTVADVRVGQDVGSDHLPVVIDLSL
ncbi:MAG: endonuclease/exonuclease/phosphatase family protein [Cyanobacteria bacterium P01_D01_bin.71]